MVRYFLQLHFIASFYNVGSVLQILFPLKGLASLVLTAVSRTKIKVTFVAATNAPKETFFRASAGDHSCEVSANAHLLSCNLTGLASGSKYTVEAVECIEDDKCSDPIRDVAYTLPDGGLTILNN